MGETSCSDPPTPGRRSPPLPRRTSSGRAPPRRPQAPGPDNSLPGARWLYRRGKVRTVGTDLLFADAGSTTPRSRHLRQNPSGRSREARNTGGRALLEPRRGQTRACAVVLGFTAADQLGRPVRRYEPRRCTVATVSVLVRFPFLSMPKWPLAPAMAS